MVTDEHVPKIGAYPCITRIYGYYGISFIERAANR